MIERRIEPDLLMDRVRDISVKIVEFSKTLDLSNGELDSACIFILGIQIASSRNAPLVREIVRAAIDVVVGNQLELEKKGSASGRPSHGESPGDKDHVRPVDSTGSVPAGSNQEGRRADRPRPNDPQ